LRDVSPAMKFRMSRQLQKSEARIASQADRGVDRQAPEPARRRFATLSGAASDAKQEALWAKLIAERPDTLSEIAMFIQGARRRIAGPPTPSRRAGARSDDA